jgi:hypothetical protein
MPTFLDGREVAVAAAPPDRPIRVTPRVVLQSIIAMSNEQLGDAITHAEERLATDPANTGMFEHLTNLVGEWNRRVSAIGKSDNDITATADAGSSDTPPPPSDK